MDSPFLEIVSPVTSGTTAGRLLERAGGDCGYMAIYEVDDLDVRMAHLSSLGVRTVWQGDFRQIRGRHLHPKDTGGTLVSIDQPHDVGEWHWAGPTWRECPSSTVATGITAITLASADPARLQQRWQQLGIDTAVMYTAHVGADRLVGVTLATAVDPPQRTDFRICGVDFMMTSTRQP